MLIRGDARQLPLVDNCVDCVVTSPPYFSLRNYGVVPSVWGGDPECQHAWGDSIQVNATNHTDKRRWNHARNGRDEEQPTEKRVAWLRTLVDQGNICELCGAWRGCLGLEPTPDLYAANVVAVFREVSRVMKPTASLWLNLGDSYAAGGRGGGGSFMAERRDAAWQKQSTLNGWRRQPPGCKEKDLLGIPWMVAFALRADGWYLRSDIIWAKPNPMPESVTDRPTKAHEYLFLLTKSERYFYDAQAIAEPVSVAMLQEMEQGYDGLGLKDYESAGVQNPSSVKRRIIERKLALRRGGRVASYSSRELEILRGNIDGNMSERGVTRTTEGLNLKSADEKTNGVTRNRRTVWSIPTMPYAGAHFATMPEALVEPCILAGCPLGGLVLDPFVGSGTAVAVAERLGRRGVGVDLSYQDLAKERTAQRGIPFTEVGVR